MPTTRREFIKRSAGAVCVGVVMPSLLLSEARGLLFPTTVNEAFGLVLAEALASGTPVICSSCGACPELITDETGFVCRTDSEYVEAFRRISEIDPGACREKALRDYHYLRMARDYVRQYEIECEGRSVHRPGGVSV